MRKIESDLIAAIKSRKPFSKGNTTVEPLGSGPVNVRLHGNLIAVIAENHLQINACGWRSATTKSRLNAILRAVAPHCVIYQSKNKWLIDDARKNVIEAWDGTVRIVPIP